MSRVTILNGRNCNGRNGRYNSHGYTIDQPWPSIALLDFKAFELTTANVHDVVFSYMQTDVHRERQDNLDTNVSLPPRTSRQSLLAHKAVSYSTLL